MSQEPKINLPAFHTQTETARAVPRGGTNFDPGTDARLKELENKLRGLKEISRAPSKLALLAVVLSLAALFCCGAQLYYSWPATTAAIESTKDVSEPTNSLPRNEGPTDPRTQLTLTELAKRSPTLRGGTLQAWWEGEQARQVQRLEAQAKRQILSGDREGATRSISRADAIRGGIGSLADFEKPTTR